MAYDRYDPRRRPSEQWRGSDDGFRDRDMRDRGNMRDRDREERGFFERAGDEIASWFGDDEAERRRRDEQMGSRDDYGRDDERSRSMGRDRGRFERDDDRSARGSREREPWGAGDREDRGYRPIIGDYGRSEGPSTGQGYPRSRSDRESVWGRDEYRRTSFAGDRPQHDPHYQQWRQRQIDDLDRDYDDYRREHQSKFENDFGSWRERRQSKRQMLGQIREHMEVMGNDGEHVGTVDRVAGDRLILAKSDADSGGVHHSLSCTEIDRIDGDRVLLDINATEARIRWRDESRERALFEREDQGEAGPQSLERSFSGTYR
jgi:hypothetical protein